MFLLFLSLSSSEGFRLRRGYHASRVLLWGNALSWVTSQTSVQHSCRPAGHNVNLVLSKIWSELTSVTPFSPLWWWRVFRGTQVQKHMSNSQSKTRCTCVGASFHTLLFFITGGFYRSKRHAMRPNLSVEKPQLVIFFFSGMSKVLPFCSFFSLLKKKPSTVIHVLRVQTDCWKRWQLKRKINH